VTLGQWSSSRPARSFRLGCWRMPFFRLWVEECLTSDSLGRLHPAEEWKRFRLKGFQGELSNLNAEQAFLGHTIVFRHKVILFWAFNVNSQIWTQSRHTGLLGPYNISRHKVIVFWASSDDVLGLPLWGLHLNCPRGIALWLLAFIFIFNSVWHS
jgi:hypothetical protein